MKCAHCGQALRRETTGARLLVDERTGDWWCRANPSNGGDAAPHEAEVVASAEAKCTYCGAMLHRTDSVSKWENEEGSPFCSAEDHKWHGAEPVEPGHWKVDVSFYVKADTARDAERRVVNELNSPAIQKYIGDTVGDADVHEGDTVAWNMEG